MTEEEIAALPWLNTPQYDQWKRYGLFIETYFSEDYASPEEIANQRAAIRYHNLVTRYLDDNLKIASKFRREENGYMYYDILKMAEDKYLESAYSGFELRKILGEKYDFSRN